jgi:hypothetical protein
MIFPLYNTCLKSYGWRCFRPSPAVLHNFQYSTRLLPTYASTFVYLNFRGFVQYNTVELLDRWPLMGRELVSWHLLET